MKKSGLLLLFFLILLAGCSKDKPVELLIDIMPEETVLFITVNNLDNLSALLPKENILPDYVFDFSRIEEFGADIKSPAGIAVTEFNPEKNETTIIAYIPASNTSKLKTGIIDQVKSSNPAALFAEAGGITEIDLLSDTLIYIKESSNYLKILFTKNRNAKRFLDSRGLSKDSQLMKTLSDINRDIIFSVNVNRLLKNYENNFTGKITADPALALIDFYRDFGWLSTGMNYLDSNFSLKVCAAVDESSIIFKIIPKAKKNTLLYSGLKPLIISAFAFDISNDIFLKKIFTKDIENDFADFKKELHWKTGIDYDSDMADVIDGNFGFAVYDGASVNMLNYNFAITMGLKDRKKAALLADKIDDVFISKNPMFEKKTEKIHGVESTVYSIMMGIINIYTGIHNNDYIIASGRSVFENLINDSSNAMDYLNDSRLAEITEKQNQFLFYLNMEELSIAYDNLNQILPAENEMTQKLRDSFKYFILFSNIDKKGFINGELKISTSFNSPFFEGLKEIGY